MISLPALKAKPQLDLVVEEEYTHSQGGFLNDLTPDGVVAFVGGYGSGKSHIGARKAFKLAAMNPRSKGVILGPSHGQVMDTAYLALAEFLEENNIPYQEVRGQRPAIILPWGNRRRAGPGWIYFRSLDRPSSIKGIQVAWAWIDEAGSIKEGEEAFNVLISRVRCPLANLRQTFITTTGEAPWLRERFVEEAPDNYRYYSASTYENIHLPKFYVEQLLQALPDNLLDVYLFGGFMPPEQGLCYNHFRRDVNLRMDLLWNPALPAVHTLDFNVNPHCSLIGQTDGRNAYIFDEIVIPNGSTPEAAQLFIDRYGSNPGGVHIHGDPSGTHRNTASKLSDYAVLEKAYGDTFTKGNVYSFYRRSDPGFRARVNCSNAMLKNSIGESHLFVHPRCRHLIYDLEHVTWLPDGRINKTARHKKTGWTISHTSDAMAYWMEVDFPILRPSVKAI